MSEGYGTALPVSMPILLTRPFVTISSGFGRLFAMCLLRLPKHSGGPLQWGRINNGWPDLIGPV